jgi:hypothetical protein
VDTSPSGGRRKIRTMRGFSAKIISRPPTAGNSENLRTENAESAIRWLGHSGLLPVPPIVRPRALSRIRSSAREIVLCSAAGSSRISLDTPSHCGSRRVEQSWSAFTAITSKKSA